MKRCKDDNDDVGKSPKIKRTDVSESSRQPQMVGEGNARKLTTNDALEYLKVIKDRFQGTSEKYNEFFDIMKDFKAQRIDTRGIIARVKELFAEDTDLLSGFNTFLPQGSKIIPPAEDEPRNVKKRIEFEVAIKFVNKIKARLQDDNHLYRSFLGILNSYRMGSISISEVHLEVADLLHDHQDLLTEFTNFLPDNLVHSVTDHNTPNEHRSSPITTMRHLHSEMEPIASHAEHGESVDRPDPDHTMADKEHRRCVGKEKKRSEGIGPREHHRPTHKRNVHTLEDTVVKLFPQDMHDQVLCLREKVKERLRYSDYYLEFLKCLKHYHTENITRPQLQSLVNDLLGAHPDLKEEVNELIDHSEKTGPYWTDGHVPGSLKVEDGNRDQGQGYDRDERDKDRSIKGKEKNERPAIGNKRIPGSKRSLLSIKNKHKAKPIQKLDLSNCESCTPSYRLLPKNCPIPKASQRTEMDKEVLNDHCLSVTSGSEDHSFKHSLKNWYEEILFRCEDDRYEMDMLLESMKVTIKCAEELVELINNKSIETDGLFPIEDYFAGLNLRCIEIIYGDHGLDAVDELRKNVSLCLPVILIRLKQKQEMWMMFHSHFSKLWAQIYVENHQKSLDHRGFYLNQQDSKSLSTKALLAEINEISEERSKEHNLHQYVAGWKRQFIPHLEFKYSDLDIHEDFYRLIKLCSAEICSSEQLVKVIKIWRSFMGPMVGLLPQPRCIDNSEHVAETSHQSVKSGDNGVKEDGSHNTDHVGCKSDTSCSTRRHETLRIIVPPTYGTSGFSKQARPVEQIMISNASITTGPEETLGGVGNDSLIMLYSEEDELSPIVDLEKGGFAACMDTSMEPAHKPKDVTRENYHNRHRERVSDNEADADNAGQRPSNKSENVDVHDIKGDGKHVPLSERFVEAAKPVTVYAPATSYKKEHTSQVFYGDDAFYVFFRLHQALYSRLEEAKRSANEKKGSSDTTPHDSYGRFLDLLYNYLAGAYREKYEEECRTIFGTWSGLIFSIERLINKLSRQLLAIAMNKVDKKLLHLYAYEKMREPGRFVDEAYAANASMIINGNKIFRFESSLIPETDGQTRFTIQQMDFGFDESKAPDVSMDQGFAAYLSSQFLSVPEEKRQGLFMKRNRRQYASEDEDIGLVKALEGVRVANDIQYRMNCTTFRLQFVLHTQDSMLRMSQRKRRLSNKVGKLSDCRSLIDTEVP